MKRYDVAIVGSGPGGLNAAITAKTRNKDVIIFGRQDLSSKLVKAKHVNNYLGLFDMSGAEVAERFKQHLANMEIAITEERVTNILPAGSYFSLLTKEGIYEAKTLILATGVNFGELLPGEKELLGQGVSYCATCDAFLYKGKSAVVVGYTRQAEAEAEFLAETAEKVYYVPMYKGKDKDIVPELAHGIEVVMDKATGIEKNEAEAGSSAMKLLLENGEIQAHGIFVLRESTAVDVLVPGLAVDEAGKHVMVDRSMATNIPGCFAAGDLTGRSYQYIKAAGEGNVAALSAVAYLDTNK